MTKAFRQSDICGLSSKLSYLFISINVLGKFLSCMTTMCSFIKKNNTFNDIYVNILMI